MFMPTGSFRIQNLKSYASSKLHDNCLKEKVAKDNPATAPLNVRNMESETREKMVLLFNIAYFTANEQLPFSKFHATESLELGHTYFNDHACRTFTESIADVLKDQLSDKLRKSNILFSLV